MMATRAMRIDFIHSMGWPRDLRSVDPLTLGEITVAGLAGLGARSRIAAELDVRESPLFDQFVAAVRSKGFFRDPDTEQSQSDPDEEKERLARAAELHEERLAQSHGQGANENWHTRHNNS